MCYSGIIRAYVSLLCTQTVILSVTYLLWSVLFHFIFLMVIVPHQRLSLRIIYCRSVLELLTLNYENLNQKVSQAYGKNISEDA